jgi:hypothetical protein
MPPKLPGVRRTLCRAVGSVIRDRGETLRLYDRLGYFPNLVWPRSFNEKIACRKLRPYPADWVTYADKAAVRTFVASRVGERYLNRVLLVTDDPAEIRLSQLPDKFVVQATHASGRNWIVTDKASVDERALQRACRAWLDERYGLETLELWYDAMPRRVQVSAFIEDSAGEVPADYKFWVFHRRVEFIQVDVGRFSSHERTFYDRRWQRQDWGHRYRPGGQVCRPDNLDEMIEIAEALATDPDYVRIDLYSLNSARIVFGEITFCPAAGYAKFTPGPQIDFQIGGLW